MIKTRAFAGDVWSVRQAPSSEELKNSWTFYRYMWNREMRTQERHFTSIFGAGRYSSSNPVSVYQNEIRLCSNNNGERNPPFLSSPHAADGFAICWRELIMSELMLELRSKCVCSLRKNIVQTISELQLSSTRERILS